MLEKVLKLDYKSLELSVYTRTRSIQACNIYTILQHYKIEINSKSTEQCQSLQNQVQLIKTTQYYNQSAIKTINFLSKTANFNVIWSQYYTDSLLRPFLVGLKCCHISRALHCNLKLNIPHCSYVILAVFLRT